VYRGNYTITGFVFDINVRRMWHTFDMKEMNNAFLLYTRVNLNNTDSFM
jgi:hypothetical protein